MRIVKFGWCIRSVTLALLVLGLSIAWTPQAAAQSCQASGSAPIFPAQTNIARGDVFDVLVCVRNTSSTTPLPGLSVPATLVNQMMVNLACNESFCLTPIPGTLEFVPGPVNGCATKIPGVDRCEVDAGDPNRVNVIMEPGGIFLGPNLQVCFASFTVEAKAAVVANPLGQFFMQPFTGAADIQTNNANGNCPVQATGSASGSVPLFFPPLCEIQVDRQVSCDGGANFVDVGFADNVTQACVAPQGGPVVIRYVVRNAGDVDVTCLSPTGGLTDSNAGVLTGVIDVGFLGVGDEFALPDDDDQNCSDALVAGEPGTATLTCECSDPFLGQTRVDMDTAAFSCESAKMGCTWR